VSWREPLTALVECCYGRSPAALESIAHYTFEDRVVCRVRFASGPPGLLRAFTGDVREWLLGQASVLEAVAARGFPAPRVIRTEAGEALAAHGAWTGLLLTFVEGVEADGAPSTLEALGALAARLHSLPGLPVAVDSRLRPATEVLSMLPGLEEGVDRVPAVARPLHRTAVALLRRLAAGHRLPEVVLHGDCWPANAVRTPEGEIVMVDWEQSGRGPAVFEVAYLLMGSHLGLPQLPAMVVAPERIAAVVRGYAGLRPPSDEELSWLPEAVHYHVVLRAVQAGSFAEDERRWREDLWLRKSVARHAVSDEVAEIARERFVRERR